MMRVDLGHIPRRYIRWAITSKGSPKNSSQVTKIMERPSNNQIRGYKAAAHNPNVSEESKEHVRGELARAGMSDENISRRSRSRTSAPSTSNVKDPEDLPSARAGADPHNVLRGYKATLRNPHVSGEAKERAADILKEHNAL